MPKEIVRGQYHWPVENPGPEDVVASEGLVQVGWSGEHESVQVVTLGRHPVSKETTHEGMYVDLDRRGINDLIRHLRRARDQAFGRDE